MRWRIVAVSGVVLGTALIATGASGDLTLVNDPRGDRNCYPSGCSRSQLRAADVIKATAGHASGRLKHTVRVVGRFQTAPTGPTPSNPALPTNTR